MLIRHHAIQTRNRTVAIYGAPLTSREEVAQALEGWQVRWVDQVDHVGELLTAGGAEAWLVYTGGIAARDQLRVLDLLARAEALVIGVTDALRPHGVAEALLELSCVRAWVDVGEPLSGLGRLVDDTVRLELARRAERMGWLFGERPDEPEERLVRALLQHVQREPLQGLAATHFEKLRVGLEDALELLGDADERVARAVGDAARIYGFLQRDERRTGEGPALGDLAQRLVGALASRLGHAVPLELADGVDATVLAPDVISDVLDAVGVALRCDELIELSVRVERAGPDVGLLTLSAQYAGAPPAITHPLDDAYRRLTARLADLHVRLWPERDRLIATFRFPVEVVQSLEEPAS